MHRLILMRHAEAASAVSGDASRGDHDRPLTPGGEAAARAMGRVLARLGLRPDAALVSTALRARQTWDAAHEALGDAEVVLEPRLYDADPQTLRDLIEQAREGAGCLIVVAHNPGLHQLAVALADHGAVSPQGPDPLGGGFPTATAVVFGADPAGRLRFERVVDPRSAG